MSPDFLHILRLVVARFFSDGDAIHCCGYANNVKFSRNGANEPESIKNTRTFSSDRQVAAPVGRKTMLFCRIRQVAAPEVNSAVFSCILLALFMAVPVFRQLQSC